MLVHRLHRTIELVEHRADLGHHLGLVDHVKHRGIVLVENQHHAAACLAVGGENQILQSRSQPFRNVLDMILFFKAFQLELDVCSYACSVVALGARHVEMQHGVRRPLGLEAVDGQPGEQLAVTQEVVLERAAQQRLAEAARTAQEDGVAKAVGKLPHIARLVHIHKPALANLLEVLLANRVATEIVLTHSGHTFAFNFQ